MFGASREKQTPTHPGEGERRKARTWMVAGLSSFTAMIGGPSVALVAPAGMVAGALPSIPDPEAPMADETDMFNFRNAAIWLALFVMIHATGCAETGNNEPAARLMDV